MKMLYRIIAVSVGAIPLLAFSAAAVHAAGAVRIECNGDCQQVQLGPACDTYFPNSIPVALSCDDTVLGAGATVPCGSANGSCRVFGTMLRSDFVGSYCGDGGGFDVIVTCQ